MSDKLELTAGERLLLWRLRSGFSQRRAANYLKVTYQQYSAWETGKDTTKVPKQALGKITAPEKCIIYRKRAGVTQRKIADDLGCCVFTVRKMEQGVRPVDDLVEYWET